MVLIGFTWSDVLFGMLWTSLTVLIVIIAYRKMLGLMSRGSVNKEDFCELYNLEIDPASGELPFYFTSPIVKEFSLLILDSDMKQIKEVVKQECKVGGNIIRFDSSQLPNGDYFYCLKTENQKIMKKMRLMNQ